MTVRGFYTLFFGVVMLLTALSVGSTGAFLLGAAALMACLLALISVLFARATLRVAQRVASDSPEMTVYRGGACLYTLSASLFSPLPVAPLALRVALPGGRQQEFLLPLRLFGRTESDNHFPCPHVGVSGVGVVRMTIGDCFGLFSLNRRVKEPLVSVTVLPNPRDAQPLPTSPGEGETTSAHRAQADRTTPTDTRAWQEGDELGRVHWKLSMRKQQLMVHTYETPQRPDALILLDLAPPPQTGAARAHAIDLMTETCAGVLKSLLDSRRIARMPLTGDHPREMSGQEPQALPGMLTALAQESFSKPADFARALMLASRRMRRTGSTAIITASLTPAVADAAIALSRMGPRMRVYLIAPGETTTEQTQLLDLLAKSGVETEHVAA